MIRLKKGLNLPIEGSPKQEIFDGPNVEQVAVIGDDVAGMKPTMAVQVGDQVKTGQLLYTDKKTDGVRYTSPATGEVVAINRGDRRVFQSIVIKTSNDDFVTFDSYKGSDISSYSDKDLEALMIESGAWTSLRTRPYSKAATPGTRPSAIFVNTMDTNPLAPNPSVIISKQETYFKKGLQALVKFGVKVYVCSDKESKYELCDGVIEQRFDGPHPAGLVGTHIHFLNPVSEKKFVWHTGYQDVIALGALVDTGKLFTERVVSVAGPAARNPRLVKTRIGACLDKLTKEERHETGEVRIVSGSVLGGRTASGPFAFLGKFHNQVTLLEEGRHRELLGWHSPGFEKYSVKPIYISRLLGIKKFGFTTDMNGSHRSIVPIGSMEKVMPLDILPTQLVRYLFSNNTEMCVKLGALELDEEDLALCTFVDPCKNDYGPALREKLTIIEKEG